jgi:hypothetical protein
VEIDSVEVTGPAMEPDRRFYGGVVDQPRKASGVQERYRNSAAVTSDFKHSLLACIPGAVVSLTGIGKPHLYSGGRSQRQRICR